MKKIAISTDSTSGLDEDQGKSLGVFVLHLPVTINGQVFYEGKDLAYEDFYKLLTADNEVLTSQPSPGDLVRHLDSILSQGYDQVIHMPLTSAMSSSYQTASLVAKNYPGQVYVVDNHRISVAQVHGVMSALRLVGQGLPAEEIVQALEDSGPDSEIYVSFESLDYLKKGGRLALTAVANVSGFFNVIPVITLKEDKASEIDLARGPKQSEKKLLKRIESKIKNFQNNLDDYYINSGGTFQDPKRAKAWNQAVNALVPNRKVHYQYLSSTVATHSGPNAYGFAISKK